MTANICKTILLCVNPALLIALFGYIGGVWGMVLCIVMLILLCALIWGCAQ